MVHFYSISNRLPLSLPCPSQTVQVLFLGLESFVLDYSACDVCVCVCACHMFLLSSSSSCYSLVCRLLGSVDSEREHHHPTGAHTHTHTHTHSGLSLVERVDFLTMHNMAATVWCVDQWLLTKYVRKKMDARECFSNAHCVCRSTLILDFPVANNTVCVCVCVCVCVYM